jgi:hypothetical protein
VKPEGVAEEKLVAVVKVPALQLWIDLSNRSLDGLTVNDKIGGIPIGKALFQVDTVVLCCVVLCCVVV